MKRRSFVALVAGAVSAGTAPVTAMPAPWMRRMDRAYGYLVGRQSKDGAWRSQRYGSFKSGAGLTPLVAHACWPRLPAERRVATMKWLMEEGATTWNLFPVHNAGWLLALARQELRLSSLVPTVAAHLRGLQLNRALGWKEEDASFGGWSYAGRAAQRKEGRLPAMQEANLSATVLAVAGLRAAGMEEDDAVLKAAAQFISRCQNWSPEAAGRSAFDDGGFFQMENDLSRNKAGVAGSEESGRRRFRSYYSATADGLRGLLMCGVKAQDPRVSAALRWLKKNPAMDDVRDLVFYANYARGRASAWLPGGSAQRPSAAGPRRRIETRPPGIPGVFPAGHSLRQDQDGSYANPAGEMREDDPLVATSLMLLSGRELT